MKKSWIVIPLTTALVLGNIGNCFAASFTDINNVPWAGAVQYINEVADLGLMAGDADQNGNKVFRAKDNVTYCEVMQLAYNLLKATNNLGSTSGLITKWSSVLTSYAIPAWAQEAVAYGLENSILSVNDVSKFMDSTGKNRTAMREDTAVIFGKSMSKISTPNASATLSFLDSASVAPTSVPYVDLLVRLGVLAGDDQNNFNPKKNINRAEMAVIVSKTNTALKSQSSQNTKPQQTEVSGTVISLDEQGMLTLLVNGKNLGFIGNNSVPVYNGATQVPFKTIGKGDVVTINYTGSTLHKITITYDAEVYKDESATLKGQLIDLTYDGAYFKETSGTGKMYPLTENPEYILDGRNSSMKTIQGEIDDEYVLDGTLTLDSDGNVSKIDVSRLKEDELKGELKKLSSSSITIELKSGREISYDLLDDEDDVTVKIDGSSSDYAELKEYYDDDDDTITVELTLNSDDEVKRIDAEIKGSSSKSGSGSGEITRLSKNEIRIGSKTYDIEDENDITIKVEDGTEESEIKDFDDLMEAVDDGKLIKVDVTVKSGNVTKITGEVVGFESAELQSIRTSKDTLTVKLDSGNYTYEYTSGVDIELDRDSCDIDDLSDALGDDDIEIDVTMKDGKITEIIATIL